MKKEVTRKTRRGKHIPQRTCVGCHQVDPKRSLVRIVRTPDGIRIDPTGKLSGRGVYLHEKRSCWETGLKGAVDRGLKVSLSAEEKEHLTAFMSNLPADT
jgi:predicted RNA-binding protein YlxR (DUF448 family)